MVAKNKSKNKGKSVDEEASLKVIENTEFVAMRKMQRQLPKPSTSEAELDLLVAHGLLRRNVSLISLVLVILERLGRILGGVSVMPARVEEYDAAHPPPEGFGRAFKLEIAVAGGGGAVVEEPAEEGDEDDDAVAGPMVVAATGPGSSSARLITGLFEGHHSYVEYVPDPRIAQYILSSRKRKSEVAAKHILPKRQRSIRQIASTAFVVLIEGRSVVLSEVETEDEVPLITRPRKPAPCAPSVTVVSASVLEALPIPSFEVVEDDLFDVPLPNLGFSGVAGNFKKVIKPSEDTSSSLALDAGGPLQDFTAASLPRIASPAPRVEEEAIGTPVSPPMEHRVEVNLGSPFAAPILPTGLSLLDNLEAAAREDAVNGEPADNNPSSVAAVDAAGTSSAGQPLTSTPSTLLLTQGGEELVQLGRVERLSELVSLWENFSGAYGAKLKSLFQDQDVLFGPHEAQFTAIAEANLKRKEDELARTEVVLTYEKAQRALMESALNAKVLEAEKVRDSSLQAVTAAQNEVSALKKEKTALVKDKESWQKEREEMVNTLRTSQNQAESALKSVQDLQEKLAAAHDQFRALQTKLTGAQDQFWALYEAVKPIIAAVCRQEDFAQGLRGIIPIVDPSMTAEFAQRWDEAKVELGGLTDQILEQMDVLPAVPPAP
ncbi:uncharacterized protein [Miscanthus floridulus]|uniref:uncharacterized protein n=1 Tax=Miscanthus floridulus TaxID=154761 RepID=UPI0034595720